MLKKIIDKIPYAALNKVLSYSKKDCFSDKKEYRTKPVDQKRLSAETADKLAKYPVFAKQIDGIKSYSVIKGRNKIISSSLVKDDKYTQKIQGFISRLMPFFTLINDKKTFANIGQNISITNDSSQLKLKFRKNLIGLFQRILMKKTQKSTITDLPDYIAGINQRLKKKFLINKEKIDKLGLSDDELLMVCAHELTHACMGDMRIDKESSRAQEYRADTLGLLAGTFAGVHPKVMQDMLN
jgi:hypothetical protein